MLLVGTLMTLPINLIRHPVTGQSLFQGIAHIKWRLGAFFGVAADGMYLLARLLA